MRILITGGSGFVASHLAIFWADTTHQIFLLSRKKMDTVLAKNTSWILGDITDEVSLHIAFKQAKPTIIIHAAASSKPNDCELQKPQCYFTNVTGTQHVINACKMVGASLIFMSTDFVFGHDGPYQEGDAYCPVNYYGETKMMAEQLIVASSLHYAIVRTVLVYGKKLPHLSNTFLHWVKDNLQQRKPIKVFTDQTRSPTYIADLCSGLQSIIHTGFEGILHLCGAETITPFALAKAVANYLELDENLILPVTRNDFPEAAMRPINSVLNIKKAQVEINFRPTEIQQALPQIFG